MSLGIVIGLLIVLLVAAWALRPLLVARQARRQLAADESNQALENLLFERETALVALRDLQFDYEMGKLSEEDFETLNARYRARAIDVLRQLDGLGVAPDDADAPAADSLDDWIEQAVAAAREGKKPHLAAPPPAPDDGPLATPTSG